LRSASSRSTPSARSGWEDTAARKHSTDCLWFWMLERLANLVLDILLCSEPACSPWSVCLLP
jgi:hypothetical protein